MPENSIGLIPPGGYSDVTAQQSAVAIKYLSYLNTHRGEKTQIQHAGNGGEQKIGAVPVDGKFRGEIWQIHGCFIHSHMNCTKHKYDPRAVHAYHQVPHEAVYEKTLNFDDRLKAAGYHLNVIWECEIEKQLKENREMKKYFEDTNRWLHLKNSIDPRDALYGGRTSVFKLLTELTEDDINEGYEIAYLDVNRLA